MSVSFTDLIKDPTCNGITYAKVVPDGWVLLYHAVTLWDLAGSPKGQALLHLLNEITDVDEPDEAIEMTLPQVRSVRDLFQTIEQDLRPLINDKWDLLPQFAGRVKQAMPEYVDVWQRDEQTVSSIVNLKYKLLGVRFFLQGALCFETNVDFGIM